jgi:hypothetical protein
MHSENIDLMSFVVFLHKKLKLVDALLSLKGAITSDPGELLSTWSTSYSPCNDGWTGVSCDSNGRVTCM